MHSELTFRNENETISVNGSDITKKKFTLSDINLVNKFLKSNAAYATVIETNLSDSTKATDSVLALSTNTIANQFITGGKLRITCDDATNKRFVISENCATTDPGVTIKPINKFGDVATDLAGVTMDSTNYYLCYD
jgi:hypothetical protein